ncbi:Protein kinase, partial [Nannochloropsis gaditana]
MPAVKEDYDVLEVIGQGSFGKVCRVRRVEDGKVLVWKEINYAHMRPLEKQRIADEVNILKDLRNPFIVRFYDHVIERASKKCYIIMEHCPGGDLRRLIKTCRREGRWIDEGFIWRVLAQLIVALKDCHRRARPILHRDIKPANVLLDQDRNIKLADFGLAKELDNERAFAATNVGTPYYMSPELVNHQSYDDGADLWSVGCLLYEAAALRPPFDASSHASLAHKINAGKISRIPDRYSDELQQVIRAMLHKNPAKRPQLETLEKAVPSLAPHLRESRALLLEYELQARYHARMKQVRAREEEVKQRETSLRCREDALERRQRRLIERERQLQRSLQTHASPSPSIPTSRPPSDSTLLLASVSASVQAREKMRRPGLLTEEEEEEEEEEEKEEDEENLSLGSQASALCDAATAAHRNEDAHTTLEEEGSEDEDEDEDEDEEGLVYRHQTASLSTRRQDSPLGPPLPLPLALVPHPVDPRQRPGNQTFPFLLLRLLLTTLSLPRQQHPAATAERDGEEGGVDAGAVPCPRPLPP